MQKTAFLFFILFCVQLNASTKIRACYTPDREEIVSAVLMVAESNGYFKEENLNVEIIKQRHIPTEEKTAVLKTSDINQTKKDLYLSSLPNELEVLRKTAEGDCQISSTTLETVFLKKLVLKSIKPIALYMYGQEYDTHLLVSSNSNIQNVKELKGKSIRIGQIGTRMVLEKILKENGLKMSDVKITVAAPDKIEEDLLSGKYQAVIAYNPTTALLLAKGSVKILESNIVSKFFKNPLPHSMLISNKNFFSKQDYKSFMNAFQKAATYMSKNPTAMIYAFSDKYKGLKFSYGNYSPAIIEKSASLFNIPEPYYFESRSTNEKDLSHAITEFHNELVATQYIGRNFPLQELMKSSNDKP